MNESINQIYNDFLMSDGYTDIPEVRAEMRRDASFDRYMKRKLKCMPRKEYIAVSNAASKRATADSRTGFILGFKYAARLMADVYGGFNAV